MYCNVKLKGAVKMGSSKTGNSPVFFIQQMMHNKFLLLAVVLAVSAAAYFCIGLIKMLGY